ncbi:MAG: mechanosensitive ion channel [Balneolaceae bacterium]|nr:mechanosensitive ion channel [Balneolaceae bacterium]
MESMSWSEILEYVAWFFNVVLFEVKDTPITIGNVFVFILFIGLSIATAYLVRKVLIRKVLDRFNIDKGMSYTLSRVTQYVIVSVGVLLSLQFIGLDLSSLAVVFGLLSVGIGFGLQNVTSNFISGLIILFERPIAVGDRVSVNNIEGDITQIDIRSTKVRTINNISIIVPNSEFVSKDVINYSYGDPTYRLDIDVGVSYGSDLEKVLKALMEVAEDNESVMDDPEPEVHLVEFGDSSWNMQLRAWIGDVKYYPKVRNELNQAVVRKFREHGVEIPFPQRDLHLRSTVPLSQDLPKAKNMEEKTSEEMPKPEERARGEELDREEEDRNAGERAKREKAQRSTEEDRKMDPRDRERRDEVKRREREMLEEQSRDPEEEDDKEKPDS